MPSLEKSDLQKIVGARIQKLREERGFTQVTSNWTFSSFIRFRFEQ